MVEVLDHADDVCSRRPFGARGIGIEVKSGTADRTAAMAAVPVDD